MYQDTKDFVWRCGSWQRHGNINTRDAMPLTNNLQIELFDVWGINYMGPFPKSRNCEYILVAVDYISKWVEALPCHAANAKNSKKMFEETIFLRFGVPRMVIMMEEPTSLIRTFTSICQNMGSVTTLLLLITPDKWPGRNIE
jgi:hypothetical protein